MRKNSVKNIRINGEVQKVLAETIRGEIKDPRISPLTSVDLSTISSRYLMSASPILSLSISKPFSSDANSAPAWNILF